MTSQIATNGDNNLANLLQGTVDSSSTLNPSMPSVMMDCSNSNSSACSTSNLNSTPIQGIQTMPISESIIISSPIESPKIFDASYFQDIITPTSNNPQRHHGSLQEHDYLQRVDNALKNPNFPNYPATNGQPALCQMSFPQIPISPEDLKNHRSADDQQYSPVSNAPSTPSQVFPNIPIASQEAFKNYHHCEEQKYSPVSKAGAIIDTVSSCPMCGQLFYNIMEMKKHLEMYHKKYQCDLCHKLMSHKRNVDRHRRSVHENQRGYGCPLCDYRSAHKQVVQRHLATKHQLQKEDTKDFDIHFVEPKRECGDPNKIATNSSWNVYSPPWLANQNDYNGNAFLNGSYNDGNQYVNYITDVEENKTDDAAQALCDGKTENKDVNQNSLIGGNTAKPIILCPDMDEEKIREIKGPRPIVECPEVKVEEDDVVVTTPNDNGKVQDDDRVYAQAFPGENCVRIIFQRRDNIREVKVAVPEML